MRRKKTKTKACVMVAEKLFFLVKRESHESVSFTTQSNTQKVFKQTGPREKKAQQKPNVQSQKLAAGINYP